LIIRKHDGSYIFSTSIELELQSDNVCMFFLKLWNSLEKYKWRNNVKNVITIVDWMNIWEWL